MKRCLIILLCLLILISSSACQKKATTSHGPNFYYCVTDLIYTIDASTIRGETQENTDGLSLQQMLKMYFAGPMSAELRSPFPAGLELVDVQIANNVVYVHVTSHLSQLSALDLTLVCSCITLTCLELTGAESVTISAVDSLLDGQKTITMDRSVLLLLDTVLEGE